MTINDLHQFDWLAFCYIANELSPADRERFEEALAVDQVAREALARAVELGGAVALAESQLPAVAQVTVVRHSRVNIARRMAWVSVGVAASLLLAVLVTNLAQRASLSALAQPEQAHSGELASLWTESRAELPSVWQTEAANASGEGLAAAAYLDDSLDEDAGSLAIAETPSWMMAALSAESGHVSEESAELRMEN